MNPILYLLITNKYATLREIRDEYTMDEVIDLYEACKVNLYNKVMALKEKK